jgi:excisionase family DNA binding protein
MGNMRDNLNSSESLGQNGCSVCKDLLVHLQRFFDMFENARKTPAADWLTVEDIAKELRISKNVVYRLIRNGELEAVNIVETNGRTAQRGHYRVKRSSLKNYLEAKKVKPLSNEPKHVIRSKRSPRVKNHLGL